MWRGESGWVKMWMDTNKCMEIQNAFIWVCRGGCVGRVCRGGCVLEGV